MIQRERLYSILSGVAACYVVIFTTAVYTAMSFTNFSTNFSEPTYPRHASLWREDSNSSLSSSGPTSREFCRIHSSNAQRGPDERWRWDSKSTAGWSQCWNPNYASLDDFGPHIRRYFPSKLFRTSVIHGEFRKGFYLKLRNLLELKM